MNQDHADFVFAQQQPKFPQEYYEEMAEYLHWLELQLEDSKQEEENLPW